MTLARVSVPRPTQLDASEKSHAALESAVATTSRDSAAALLDARSSFSIHLESSLAATRDDAASDHAALVAELAETTKTLDATAQTRAVGRWQERSLDASSSSSTRTPTAYSRDNDVFTDAGLKRATYRLSGRRRR